MQIKTKRLFSLLLVIVLLFSNSHIAHALSNETILHKLEYPVLYPNDGFSYPDLMNSSGPNVEELEKTVDIDIFRNTLIEGFSSCPSSVNISGFKIPNTSANWTAIKNYIWYETPELFQISGLGYSTSGGYISAIYANYHYSADQYRTMYQEFLIGANNLLAGIKGNNNLNDIEKALLLHDRLAIWCEYDYANLVANTLPDESYSAYGVFAKKTAVCMGYALAYDYLLLQVGIDSYYCSSDTLNHAWNIVYINDSKYHVDVTWDDPVWDISGQVLHNNFLRSTAGIIATDHDATDYDSSPTDTTFDSYYWQNSETAFQLVDNDIYYIDNSASTLNKISNGVTTNCRNLDGIWLYDASSYWPGNYSKLSYDGQNLLFSLPDAVYKYDIQTGVSTAVFTPTISAGTYYSVWGFKYDDCKLICEVINTPNYEGNTKKDYTQTQDHHIESDWINFPNSDIISGRYKKCVNCSVRLEEEITNILSLIAKSGTTIDYANLLIFTDAFICNDISQLFTVSGNTSISINDASVNFYGTGTTFTVLNDESEVCDFTIIVNGDVNGDSVCDVLDLAIVQLYASNKRTPDTLDIYAANCGIAESIDDTTYQNLVNKALELEL